jgi:hypothetical protein
MPKRTRNEFQALLFQYWELPNGPTRVAVLEEAVRDADARGHEPDGYTARQALLDTAVASGRADLLLTHFAWCLAKFDAKPDRYDEVALLWRYKWVAGNAVCFPDITLAQLNALLDDMARRFAAVGAGGRAVANLRHALALHRGDAEEAAATFRTFQRTPRDYLSNCPACEADDAVDYHISRGQYRRAVAAAAGVLTGRLSCAAVPDETYAALLVPLVRLGNPGEAARLHRAGYRRSLRSGDGVACFGAHLTFLGLTDSHAAGVRALDRTLPAAFGGHEPLSRFRYYAGAKFLLDRLVRSGATSRVRVPPGHPLADRSKGVTAAELRDWVAADAADLAARFDARNGTTAFARELIRLERLHRHVIPFDSNI